MSRNKPDGKKSVERLAVMVAPHVGGLFTHYLRLRDALEVDGIQTFCVELGDESSRWNEYTPYDGSDYRQVPISEHGLPASKSFVDWICRERIDAVLLSPASPVDVFAALPHLPTNVRVFVRFSEISPINYRRSLQFPEAIDGLIINCPRQHDDLISKYGLDAANLSLIPNGVDVERFTPDKSSTAERRAISILFLDRIHNVYKRALLLPRILRELDKRDIEWRITIAGDGPDKDRLLQKLTPWLHSDRVSVLGWVNWQDVPALMARHDVYLKLSRSEASPSALMEAMACGNVPVASRIKGVTDFVIRDEIEGLLVQSGDVRAIVQAITQLSADRNMLRQLSLAARRRIVDEFSADIFGDHVREFFRMAPSVSQRIPLPWSAYRSQTNAQHFSPWRRLSKALPLEFRIRIREALGMNS